MTEAMLANSRKLTAADEANDWLSLEVEATY